MGADGMYSMDDDFGNNNNFEDIDMGADGMYSMDDDFGNDNNFEDIHMTSTV